MKNIIIAVIASVLLTFIVTENYMISNMKISGAPGAYIVTVFGAEFEYKQGEQK
jgi:hypothetical protein